jgi:hypothetical protein
MRRFLTHVSVGALIVAAGVFVISAQAADAPQVVTLDECGKKQPAVEFPHAKHMELTECVTCHHTQPDLTATSGETVETCASCHKDPEDAKTPSCTSMSPTKNPFHIKCMGCHKEQVKADASLKAPTKCNGCHKKT